MNTIGGFVCVRNGNDLDYSWKEAVRSLLPVCSEVVICDSESTDGTLEDAMAMTEDGRIRVVPRPWPNPFRQGHQWFLDWLNDARRALSTDYCIYLDADEVLSDSPQCHSAIREAASERKCLRMLRLNFWRDAHSVVPEGEVCGRTVIRFGPQAYSVVSDEMHPPGEERIVDEAVMEPRAVIFHLGFLRKRDAIYKKSRVVQGAWVGDYDKRLEAGEIAGINLWETECSFTERLERYDGYYPASVRNWLAERGHIV